MMPTAFSSKSPILTKATFAAILTAQEKRKTLPREVRISINTLQSGV